MVGGWWRGCIDSMVGWPPAPCAWAAAAARAGRAWMGLGWRGNGLSRREMLASHARFERVEREAKGPLCTNKWPAFHNYVLE